MGKLQRRKKKVRSWQCTICAYVTGEASKVWCYKNQRCIGTWNVKSMNQAKLEVVIQDMARVNINILGISEPKWTGMGEFNSGDCYIYYYRQIRRNGVALTVYKRVQNPARGCNLKNDRMLCLFLRQTIQYHSDPSLCPDQKCWRSWSWTVL